MKPRITQIAPGVWRCARGANDDACWYGLTPCGAYKGWWAFACVLGDRGLPDFSTDAVSAIVTGITEMWTFPSFPQQVYA